MRVERERKSRNEGWGRVFVYILAGGNRLPRAGNRLPRRTGNRLPILVIDYYEQRAGNRLPTLVIDYRKPRTGNRLPNMVIDYHAKIINPWPYREHCNRLQVLCNRLPTPKTWFLPSAVLSQVQNIAQTYFHFLILS